VAVPKQVDHEQRRRALAEAVFTVIGTRGLDAVGVRDVAEEAGVSVGAVQHYFRTKDEMLLFALSHMRARVLDRLHAGLGERPSRRDRIRAALRVMLPVDEPGRQEAAVNIAFFSAATVNPAYAAQLREGYGRILAATRDDLRAAAEAGETVPDLDPEATATELYFLSQGLVGPVLIGLFGADEALALLDRRLERVFR
jgi:AcrR family transcriptional regulator